MSVVLRGTTWDHPRGLDSVRACSHQGDVTVEWSARSLQAFADAPLEELVREYDLLVIDHPHVPHAVRHGLLSPLDGVGHDAELATLADQSVGLSHPSYEWGGRQYGLAVDAAAQVAVYRPDLLPEPPRDWDAVFALAATGAVLWPAKPVDAISSFLTVARQSGVDICVAFDRRDGLNVLAHLHRLADAVPRECLSYNPIQVAELLATSDRFAYAPLAFGYTNYSRAGFRRHRLRYTDIPGVAGSCLGGAGIAVSARSRHLPEAVAHAFWLAGAEVQRGPYYRGGGQPGNAVAWDDPATNADSLDFFRDTRATLEAARIRPHYDGWLDVQDAAGLAVNRALRGEIDDHECLRLIEAAQEQSHAR